MFSGSIPALVTPFKNGVVDETAFRRLVDWQIEEGSSALVPCGTTGEAPTLSNDEQHRLFAITVEQANGRVPVIAGCGSNDTQTALWHMQEARAVGAQAALMVAPYYNRPSQAGLLAHFSYLAERVDLPIVLYNVPGRTVTDIKPETVIELARRFPDRIVGIKDASGDMTRLTAHRLALGAGFAQICGNDDMALQYNAGGGTGCISVTANIAPKLCAEFQAASLAGDLAKARELNEKLFKLHQALFTDASPGPLKYAMARVLGWIGDEVRLPLVACSAESRAAVDAGLALAGLT
ncbi:MULTISPECIES: 4-hydroxy-tetrahydrodipicolinate synthase [unclassified Novosphingobium]|uniref:4-hydroxy-tetrahydrodipicolinate synthase n=1 Tax=unclassified Novosphingobium TaxID=2644732 RepID=UPI000ECB94D5|nr:MULTISPECIES: 4-hydroxy-tetrahydrodipicolinate synthase [unclassified Novosphingobium]HCF25448.1 4-hydroxy-tetrahydrodipicolinate synthase [Novosphingobium sp.]HQV03664.1 4-hydroxy-tetrahydrodipicolinate synthase [Novosphingobium sp.]